MSEKEFTLEISGNSIFCSREPKTPEELSRFYAAVIKVQSQTMDDLAKDLIKNGIKEGIMNIQLTEYERQLIVEFLDCYVSEYGSKSWPDETKDSVKSILNKLKANESTCRYIGGILK